jgi:hypothetical protein
MMQLMLRCGRQWLLFVAQQVMRLGYTLRPRRCQGGMLGHHDPLLAYLERAVPCIWSLDMHLACES